MKGSLTKSLSIDINGVTFDRTRNLRDIGDTDYDLKPLIEDLAFRGQLTPLTLERVKDAAGEHLFPVRGFRRGESLLYLHRNTDPGTQGPYIDPKTGKPFKFVDAFVVEELTDAERLELMFDHGQTRNLSTVELFRACERAFDAKMREIDIVKMARSLFDLYYPPNRKVEDNDQARLEHRKGVLQQYKDAWKSPTLLHDAYVDKLRGHHTWPTKAAMREGLKIHEAEIKADRTNTISKANPGPEFMKWWNKLQTEVEKADDAGTAVAPIAMMNRGDVEEIKKLINSRILKTLIDVLLRVVPRERLPEFDKHVCEIETIAYKDGGTIPEAVVNRFKSIMDVIVGTAPVDAPVTEAALNTAAAAVK